MIPHEERGMDDDSFLAEEGEGILLGMDDPLDNSHGASSNGNLNNDCSATRLLASASVRLHG